MLSRAFQGAVVLSLVSNALAQTCNNPPVKDVHAFLKQDYDYIIVGGGTAGLTVASRLAENKRLRVGVIEAGVLHFLDPKIDIPANSVVSNPEYDWNVPTVAQSALHGRNFTLPAGKLLGGSSGINGMAWTRASALEYDAWEQFGPDGEWGWDGVLPYFKKSETHTKMENPYPGISAEAAKIAEKQEPQFHGYTGPMVSSLNSFYFEVVKIAARAMNTLGIPTIADPGNGHLIGVTNARHAVDPNLGTRTYSAMGYLCFSKAKPNLHVLTGAHATRIITKKSTRGIQATSVQFISSGTSYAVNATKEIILSAGTLHSPQVLELSGIGNRTILEANNIPVVLELPAVGENLQEHLFVATQWELKPGYETFDILRNNATFAAEQQKIYNETRKGLLVELDTSVVFIPLETFTDSPRQKELLKLFDSTAPKSLSPLADAQLAVQRAWLPDPKVAAAELVQWSRGNFGVEKGKNYITIIGGFTHAASRGTIHIASNDPFAYPVVDPKFLSSEVDTAILVDILKFVHKIGETSPLKEVIAKKTLPTASTSYEDHVRDNAAGGNHWIGTNAMAPKELGGVVDSFLKVHGTTNLRVIDASIFPTHLAHLQSSVYAIAEKAAHMILQSL